LKKFSEKPRNSTLINTDIKTRIYADMRFVKKSDIIAAAAAGALIALFFWIVVYKTDAEQFQALRWHVFFILPALAVFWIFAAGALARWRAAFWQLSKFILVGALNTFIDLAVFNSLRTGFGVFEAGILMTSFKAISFIAAVANSFLWNKFWVFEKKQSAGAGREFSVFFAISAIGIMLNTGFFYFLTAIIGSPAGISDTLWHNLSVLLAGLAVFVWNFLGYKRIVFGAKSGLTAVC
jgi:putative flippase GtrA